MKTEVFNEYNLRDDEIDEVVVRVKAFIINNKNELLLASSNGGIQLVGGHVEADEDWQLALQREIKEEAGLEVLLEDISEPFYEIKHYMKNYYNTSKNAIAKMVYYLVKTESLPNTDLMKRTKREEDYKFEIKFIPFDEFEEYVKQYMNNEKEINEVIAKEMLSAFEELKRITK